MKKSLQGSFYFLALFSLLLASVPGSARRSIFSSPVYFRHAAVTLQAPPNITVSTDPWMNSATNVALGNPVLSAENDHGIYTVSNDAPAIFPLGATAVTWKATDGNGNNVTAVQTVTVLDTEKPHIFRRFEISVVNDPGQCGAAVPLLAPDYYDNTGGVIFTNDAPAYFPVGSILITWTGTDQYGNSDTSTQWVTVIDNELPTIHTTNIQAHTEPGKCGATVTLGTPVTADNCGVVSVTSDAPAFFPSGTTIVHWTVTDRAGYTNTADQTVVVTDMEKPKITAPASITLNNTPGKCGSSAVLAAPVVSDNCGVASVTNNAPALLPTGTTIVTWTVTDLGGNTSAAAQTVVVKDVQAPVFSNIPANVTVSCDGVPPVIPPVASDNCTAPVVSFSQVSTQVPDISKTAHYNYTITRTWTAKDAAGNTATARQVITVQDKTGPVISVPANISKPNDANVCGATVNFNVSAADNCGSPVTLIFNKKSGTLFSTGTTTVTVTAKDVSGNTSTQNFTVTVHDMQKPTIKAPSNISTSTGNSSVSNINLGTPVTTDNCGVTSVTNNAPASYPVGVTTVTWMAKDAAGNPATATQTVTVTSTKKRSHETAAVYSADGIRENAAEEGALRITVAPNPSSTYFTLRIQGRNDRPVALRVVDVQGRVVETKAKLAVNSSVQVGESYLPGLYFAEFMQGTERKVIQLMKIK